MSDHLQGDDADASHVSTPVPAQGSASTGVQAAGLFAEAAPFFAGDTRTNRERMLAGDWYVADDPESARIAAHARRELYLYERAFFMGDPGAIDHLRSAVPQLGKDAILLPPVRVDYGDRLFVGEGTFANYGLTALDVAEIRIGAHCQIGPNVQLLTPVHPLEPTPRRVGLESADPITIEDNVWLGGGVIVCPGVRIGEGCVVGAGSVVAKDLPPYSLAVGTPARVIRTLDDSTFAPRHASDL